MEIRYIDRLFKEADLKPNCHRCHYSTDGVHVLDGEWICDNCLTQEEIGLILKHYGKI